LTANGQLEPESLLSKLIACLNGEREALLESSTALEVIYQKAALPDHPSPPSTQDEVNLQYVCFIRSLNDLKTR